MSSGLIRFRLADEKKGIVTCDVALEAEDEIQAVGKLAEYITELKSKTFYHQPVLVSDSADPKVIGQELIRRLMAISDPIVYILTLHLFTEHWLNQILLKFCLAHDLTDHKFSVKLDIAKGIGKLTDDLVHNLTKFNALRNRVAHRLDYDLTKMDLDYRGYPPHFELKEYCPTLDPGGKQHHISNVLGGVMAQTYLLLHQHCFANLGFR